jgi:NADPH:quinone reductase-like Zn-dependent oxidoreductase
MRRAVRISSITGALILALADPVGLNAQSAQMIRQYQFAPASDGYELVMREVPRPTPGPSEVLVRVRATSLNRRDLSMLNNQYGPGGSAAGGIPLSDGAGEVIAVGRDVARFEVGDRVAGIFFSEWIDGERSAAALASARGGSPGGMLSEVIVTDENGLVSIPEHLSFEEAATLPCAGVTAWVGLFKRGGLKPEEYVLLEGTGGVSIFGLQFAAAAGAKPIITSSSNDKLRRARELGAIGTVNYREDENWQHEVRRLTSDAGVDHVLEVGGRDTLTKAIEALAFDSHIALIGGLSGFAPSIPVGALMGIGATASGIYVGSREDFEAMNAFISEHEIHPVVDRVFDFEHAAEAFDRHPTLSDVDRSKWNDRYGAGSYADRTHPSRFLERHISSIGTGRALDVACGAGRNAIFLAALGFEVDAVDISAVGLERARSRAAAERLEVNFLEADLEQGLPQDAGLADDYDLIVVIRYINIPIIAELARRLSGRGVFVCEQHLESRHEVAGPRKSSSYRLASNELLHAVEGLCIRFYREGIIEDPDGRRVALAQVIACREAAIEIDYC